jgi:hypothetical protein
LTYTCHSSPSEIVSSFTGCHPLRLASLETRMQYELGSNPDLLSLNKSIFIMENYFNTQKSKGFPNRKKPTPLDFGHGPCNMVCWVSGCDTRNSPWYVENQPLICCSFGHWTDVFFVQTDLFLWEIPVRLWVSSRYCTPKNPSKIQITTSQPSLKVNPPMLKNPICLEVRRLRTCGVKRNRPVFSTRGMSKQ